MPKIFDNISSDLKTGLLNTLESSYRAYFCVGYFNLRGWKLLMEPIGQFKGGEECCRVLVGMQSHEENILRREWLQNKDKPMDNATAVELKKETAKSFARQLTFGIPSRADEECLKKLRIQLAEKKVQVKLFLAYQLHAKLYLLHRKDKMAPLIGYIGSSNLTMAGLSHQGELNVDVLEQDAAEKLAKWFEDRWNDRWCIDISDELIQILAESWAGENRILPYYIYLKIAFHLSQEARSGIGNYIVPQILQKDLLPFQQNAVSIAARYLDKQGGVLISDVVGLGKTMTATAVAKLFEETFFTETLIICPKNLVEMWQGYVQTYELRARVQSISKTDKNFLEKTGRYRVVIIDESHHLRNRQGKRYAIVKEYLEKNESRVIMITATPYNKSYLDISSQLRLFIPEDKDIGICPENFIREAGGAAEFIAKYQYSPNTLPAFEKSRFSEDWQELLKLYMVRRTRTFIKQNYATYDPDKKQYYLTFHDGRTVYFPDRIPKKIEYAFNPDDEKDSYVKLYDEEVVKIISSLYLPRYGLGNYIDKDREGTANAEEKRIIANLNRAGRGLMGFCRTNLFKRLESSGLSFLVSLARHVLRNHVFVYAIEKGFPLPIGQQEAAEMDEFLEENDNDENLEMNLMTDKGEYRNLAEKYYEKCAADRNRYDWISSSLFAENLAELLTDDADKIISVIETGKNWNPAEDKKLNLLEKLCIRDHKNQKILIFTQFADTACYLYEQLKKRNIQALACVTGDLENPTGFAHRFSPVSNKAEKVKDEIRILISTDVLSEGQNLQDAHIIVNYDLPWAIIRLIQRAGRVDRIGQQSPEILCYSFLPQDGIERIIRLRTRLTQRISENAEAVGADEIFFDGDPVNIQDLYNEKSGILDEDEGDVDLTSQAYEIWNQATKANPDLKKKIPGLPEVVYSTKEKQDHGFENNTLIAYHKNSKGYEILTCLNAEGKVVSTSQSRILKMAECALDTPATEPLENHHDLVKKAVMLAETEAAKSGGQLGNTSSTRYRVYMILQRYYESVRNTLFDLDALKKTIDDIFHYPLRETSRENINRRIRLGCTDEETAFLTMQLREEGRLCVIEQKEQDNLRTPQIICSMGIRK
ncbi:MAG: helicase-related protein [Desulfococcaceae bacterium]